MLLYSVEPSWHSWFHFATGEFHLCAFSKSYNLGCWGRWRRHVDCGSLYLFCFVSLKISLYYIPFLPLPFVYENDKWIIILIQLKYGAAYLWNNLIFAKYLYKYRSSCWSATNPKPLHYWDWLKKHWRAVLVISFRAPTPKKTPQQKNCNPFFYLLISSIKVKLVNSSMPCFC